MSFYKKFIALFLTSLICNGLWLPSLAGVFKHKKVAKLPQKKVVSTAKSSAANSAEASPLEQLQQEENKIGSKLALNSKAAIPDDSPLGEIMLQDALEMAPVSESSSIPVLQGSATRILNKEAKVSVSLLTTLSSELNSPGDKVEAKILVKPGGKANEGLEALRGSKIIGYVVDVKNSRKAGRAGYVKVQFDTLRIKTGKEFPIKAQLTTESFKGKEAGKLVLYDAKLMTLGALWGTYNSLRYAPIAALYTQGLSVAVSAGIGVSLGVIGSLRRKGDTKTFFSGEKNTIQFKDSLSLDDNALQEAALASKTINNEVIGLKINLLETTLHNSEDYENVLAVKVKVDNQTESSVYPCDLLLVPKDGGDPVMADLRVSGMDLLKSVKKGEESTLTLMFPMHKAYNPQDYNLALIDPLDKAYLSKVSLDKKIENKPQ
jgi:hypothetical protein